jgi:hypothetical protein
LNEFKNATSVEREEFLKVITNAEKNANDFEINYHQEKIKHEISISQVSSLNQILKNHEKITNKS